MNNESMIKSAAISTLFLSILTVCLWIASSFTSIRLPDSKHPIQFYCTETKDDLCLTYCTAIHSAEKNITFIIYALTDTKVIQALKEKSEEGVNINIICDAKA